jgi:hypothetical protein
MLHVILLVKVVRNCILVYSILYYKGVQAGVQVASSKSIDSQYCVSNKHSKAVVARSTNEKQNNTKIIHTFIIRIDVSNRIPAPLKRVIKSFIFKPVMLSAVTG